MKTLALAAFLAAASGPALADAQNVVLVHGATMDGSGWREVYDNLTADGLKVSVVQLPHTSFADDVEATRLVLAAQDGPTVLVGHSYGGAVITEAGFADKVGALVYVAALQPDAGETLMDLSARFPMQINMKMLDDTTFVPAPETYRESIAADLPADLTDFMSASSRPMTLEPYSVRFERAAWHDKPSFGIVATDDRTIAPELQHWMYDRSGAQTVEIAASHMVYISRPADVADVIRDAAKAAE